MNKTEFLSELNHRLWRLEQNDVDERLAFYDEIIEDYVADGVPEEEAVERLGTIDEIVAQVTSEIPLKKLVAERMKPQEEKHSGKLVAMIATFPLWLPLLIVGFALTLSFYIVIWALVIVLFAVDLSLLCVSVFGFLSLVPLSMQGNGPMIGMVIGMSILCFGLFMLFFSVSCLAAKGAIKLSGVFLLWIKSLFIGKGERKDA